MKKRIWLRGILTLGLVIVAGAALVPHPNLLLARARKAPFTAQHIGYAPIAWHGDHERYVLQRIGASDHSGVFIQDLITGSVTPVKSFNDAFASRLIVPKANRVFGMQADTSMFDPGAHYLSPDHKWRLWNPAPWNEEFTAKNGLILHAYSLDGKREQQWKRGQENKYRRNSFRWLADSRRWIDLEIDDAAYLQGVTIHSLESPNADVTKTFVNRGSRWVAGITPDAHLLSYDPTTMPSSPSLIYYDTPLDDAAPISRKITIPLPADTHLYNVYLSPDGARLLWHLTTRSRLPGLPLVQQLFARLGMQTEKQEGLWISKLDGSDLHELGHVPLKPLPPQINAPQRAMQPPTGQSAFLLTEICSLYRIQWLPDGKHILFAQGNEIYTLPVE